MACIHVWDGVAQTPLKLICAGNLLPSLLLPVGTPTTTTEQTLPPPTTRTEQASPTMEQTTPTAGQTARTTEQQAAPTTASELVTTRGVLTSPAAESSTVTEAASSAEDPQRLAIVAGLVSTIVVILIILVLVLFMHVRYRSKKDGHEALRKISIESTKSAATVITQLDDHYELDPGQIQLLDVIGSGAFGVVRQARLYESCDWKSGPSRIVAVKMLHSEYMEYTVTRD